MNKLSDRLNRLSASATLAMSQKSQELKAQGVDVINMSVGEPDFNTPDYIIESAKKALDIGFTKYTPASGMQELKEAICEKLKKDNDLEYTPQQIVISTGAKSSLYHAICSIVEEGDEVIIPSPYFWPFP